MLAVRFAVFIAAFAVGSEAICVTVLTELKGRNLSQAEAVQLPDVLFSFKDRKMKLYLETVCSDVVAVKVRMCDVEAPKILVKPWYEVVIKRRSFLYVPAQLSMVIYCVTGGRPLETSEPSELSEPSEFNGPSGFSEPSGFTKSRMFSHSSVASQPSVASNSSGFSEPSEFTKASELSGPSGYSHPNVASKPRGFNEPNEFNVGQ